MTIRFVLSRVLENSLKKIFEITSQVGVIQYTLHFELKAEFICVDRSKLERVFMNLFLNTVQSQEQDKPCQMRIEVCEVDDKKLTNFNQRQWTCYRCEYYRYHL